MEPTLHKAMTTFIDNPCLKTAADLVEVYPVLLSYLETVLSGRNYLYK
jgi:hypothetical protein